MKMSNIDRSEYIIDEIGSTENIDINLSKYNYYSQLIVLKDKYIIIGYNNFKTKLIYFLLYSNLIVLLTDKN